MSTATGIIDSLKNSAKIAAGVLMRDLARALTQGAIASLKLGAQIQTLRRSFAALSAATGEYVPSLEELRKATQGMVSDSDLLLRANEALALGIPTEELDELFGAAIRLGKAMGIDATQGIQSLTLGVGRQSRLVLDNLGIIVRAEDAYIKYAKSVGKTTESLTENERRIAFQTMALDKITEKAAILGDNIAATDRAMDQWSATIKNVTTGLGEMLGPLGALAPVFQMLAPAITIIAVQALPLLARSLYGLIPPIVAVEAAIAPLLIPIIAVTVAIGALRVAWEVNLFGIRDATSEVVGLLEKNFGDLEDIIEHATEAIEKFFKQTSAAQDVISAFKTLITGPTPAAAEAGFDPYAPVTGYVSTPRGRGITIKRLTLAEVRAQLTPPEFGEYLSMQSRMGIKPSQEDLAYLRRYGIKVDETAQHGLYGIVSRPTTILAGEAGPELVSITPISQITRGRTAGQETAPRGEEGYSPTFVFNIKSLTGDRAGAKTLGQLTAEEHFLELRRRGKTI